MRKLILLIAVTTLVGGLVAAPAAAKDDGCRNVWAKGTTTGNVWQGEDLIGTARWHTSGMGGPVDALVTVVLNSLPDYNTTPPAPAKSNHHFTVEGLGSISTEDEVTFVPDFEGLPGEYEFESRLKVVGGVYGGHLVTKRASLSIDTRGNATAEWYMKGEICELSQNG